MFAQSNSYFGKALVVRKAHNVVTVTYMVRRFVSDSLALTVEQELPAVSGASGV